jgi:hypothetical protein
MTSSRVRVAKIDANCWVDLTTRDRNDRAPGLPLRAARPVAPVKTQPTYEIRVAGRFDETTVTAFDGLDMTSLDNVTVITGQFDQAALHGVLERIRSLSLDLMEVRRVA